MGHGHAKNISNMNMRFMTPAHSRTAPCTATTATAGAMRPHYVGCMLFHFASMSPPMLSAFCRLLEDGAAAACMLTLVLTVC